MKKVNDEIAKFDIPEEKAKREKLKEELKKLNTEIDTKGLEAAKHATNCKFGKGEQIVY